MTVPDGIMNSCKSSLSLNTHPEISTEISELLYNSTQSFTSKPGESL